MTYAARLPLGCEELKFLIITELDEDVDGPLVVVVVLGDLDFTGTTDTIKSGRELLADAFHQGVQSRVPQSLERK